jgi:hypothetical protein
VTAGRVGYYFFTSYVTVFVVNVSGNVAVKPCSGVVETLVDVETSLPVLS